MNRDLTVAEVAQLLGRHPSSISHQVRIGRFPGAYRCGPIWLIPPKAVEHYKRYSLGKPGRKTPGQPI